MDKKKIKAKVQKVKTQYCSICQIAFDGYGNNAQPVNDGRCCDNCNGLVIVARIRMAGQPK